jgi:hypothetical protein
MMSLSARRELVAALRPRYWGADRPTKRRMLDELVATTGYHRKYALALLHAPAPPAAPRARPRPPRRPRYDAAVQHALTACWQAANGICSKRLVPYLPELVAVLTRHHVLTLPPATQAALLALSPATADRLLAPARRSARPLGLGTTKPGTLLKQQIPIRTFADWDDAQVGFLEIDLVAHCGTTTAGEYVHTLTLTDIVTTWTECVALPQRSQAQVQQALVAVRTRLPFAVHGLDSDNGAEFINATLLRYCQQEGITFTRSRPYKKNDQAHVEQKNWSVVRQTVGYDRYEGAAACAALGALYARVRLYTNYFQPSMKLVSKERAGSRVRKGYDRARTPYQRVLEAAEMSTDAKQTLRSEYEELNPVQLLREIRAGQVTLWALRVRSGNEATIPVE